MRDIWKTLCFGAGLLIVFRFISARFSDQAAAESEPTSIVLIVVIMGGFLLLIGLPLVLVGLRGIRSTVENTNIEPGSIESWPIEKSAARNDLIEQGFTQFGSLTVGLPDHTAIFGAMLSACGTTMAVVTPRHVTLVSDYEGKVLSTTDRPAGAPLRYQLRQSNIKGSIAALWSLHRDGMLALQTPDLRPTVLNPTNALDTLVEMERQSLEHFVMKDQAIGLFGWGPSWTRVRSIANHPRRSDVIGEWQSAPERLDLAY